MTEHEMLIRDWSQDVCSSDLNVGCAIARSVEAKALHVRMGDPVFKMRDRIKRHGIQLRSSNYELYADINRRLNAVIADHSDMVEIYSIEESFFRLPVLPDGLVNVVAAQIGRATCRERVRQYV